jgi:hypothetical protein
LYRDADPLISPALRTGSTTVLPLEQRGRPASRALWRS